ncbi:hypothetical protein FRC02_010076 [Tulasnella sp. 418]|nr:hypothetical protein FRC02_010076 [Tulasnella sp. 418]
MSSALKPIEIQWACRYNDLLKHKLELRSRYRPTWSPSWVPECGLTNPLAGLRAEDGIGLRAANVLDARRTRDGSPVMLKLVNTALNEWPVLRHFTKGDLAVKYDNHTIPPLEIINDPFAPNHVIIVYPLLRDLDASPLTSFGDCIDFMEQTLEGLHFLHKNGVSHQQITMKNILMDGRRILPQGWHPMNPSRGMDGVTYVGQGSSRDESGGVRYFFIGFTIATMGVDRVPNCGSQSSAPELSYGSNKGHNPYKLDIYMLGRTITHYFSQSRQNAGPLSDIIEDMTVDKPQDRPSAKECLSRVREIKSNMQSRGSSAKPFPPFF